MFILSDQIIILFPADAFSRKQPIFRPHYKKRNKYKPLEKRSCVSVWVYFAPTMPNVGSRYSKFGFEKKNCIWFGGKNNNNNNNNKKCCCGRIPWFHLSDKKKVYLWTLDNGGGVVVVGGGGRGEWGALLEISLFHIKYRYLHLK